MTAPHTPHLLLLFAALLPNALACQLPRSLPGHSLQLLRTMALNSTHTCQQQQSPFFPDALRHNNRSQQDQHTALAILHNLLHTLSSNHIPQQWDNHARHHLLNSLHQHTHHLQQCLTHNTTLLQGQDVRITRYFRHIHRFLNANDHSDCAWQHVYLEARLCFQHLHNITSNTIN
ncbi:interferon-like [Cuculus canorus]|uniref:interferon-like n=1 Tax=Cuculus canorus TaxID=55661 RepID=UPI0023AB1B5F|nr:interferon-like [Cuculus canorus]